MSQGPGARGQGREYLPLGPGIKVLHSLCLGSWVVAIREPNLDRTYVLIAARASSRELPDEFCLVLLVFGLCCVFGGVACVLGCGLFGTNAKIFPTKASFQTLLLTRRGNIGVISGVILLKRSFSHDS